MVAQPKTALITGATSGIGRELAKLFAQDKYNLVIVARSEDELANRPTRLG
jgi:short-subunit dehydrogenase